MKFLALLVLMYSVGTLYLPTAFADHSININTADKDALISLTGIGEVKAQAIIDYRTQNGPYASIEDIQNVSGIGPATFDSIKDHITVQGGNSEAPSPDPSPAPSPSPSLGQVSPSPSASSQATVSSATGFSVDAGSDRVTIVGVDARFLARAYRGKTTVENTKFTWNFGDGSTGRGTSISHRFEYPGRYAVVVTGTSAGDTASDSFIVTAEEAQLALRVPADGSVEIESLSKRDADLSWWVLRSSGEIFTLPENSLILAGQTMRISPNTLHFHAGASTELDYPGGALALRAGDTPALPPASSSATNPPVQPPSVQTKQSKRAQAPQEPAASEILEDEIPEGELFSTSSQVAGVAAASGSMLWWAGAFAIALVGAGSIYLARRLGKREWDIIEE